MPASGVDTTASQMDAEEPSLPNHEGHTMPSTKSKINLARCGGEQPTRPPRARHQQSIAGDAGQDGGPWKSVLGGR